MGRRFNTCLNLEAKAFDFSLSGLFVGGFGLIIGMCFVGLMTALFSAVGGFAIGAFVGRTWHSGYLQRKFYWGLPLAKIVVCEKIPNSHTRSYH